MFKIFKCSLFCKDQHVNIIIFHNGQVITVQGIRMDPSECHEDDEFYSIQMKRLQLVDTEGFLLEHILKSPNILWLCWKDCPYSSLPSSIQMKNLRVLHVSENTLENGGNLNHR